MMAMIIVVGWHAQCVGVQQGKIEHNARSWLYANAHRMVRGNGSHITNLHAEMCLNGVICQAWLLSAFADDDRSD